MQHCGHVISFWRKPVDVLPQTELEGDFVARLKGHSNLSFQLRLCGCSQRAAEGGMCWCGPSPGAQAADEGCSALLPAAVPVSRAGPGPPRDSVLSPAWLPQPPPAEGLLPALPPGPAAASTPAAPPFCSWGRGRLTLHFQHGVRAAALLSHVSRAHGSV